MGWNELVQSAAMAGVGALLVCGLGCVSLRRKEARGAGEGLRGDAAFYADGASADGADPDDLVAAAAAAGELGVGDGAGDDGVGGAARRQLEVLVGTAQMLAQNDHLEEALEQYRAALQVVLDAAPPARSAADEPMMAALLNVEIGQLCRLLDRLPEADRALSRALAVLRRKHAEDVASAVKQASSMSTTSSRAGTRIGSSSRVKTIMDTSSDSSDASTHGMEDQDQSQFQDQSKNESQSEEQDQSQYQDEEMGVILKDPELISGEANICRLMSSLAEVKAMRTRLVDQRPEVDGEDGAFSTLTATRSAETMRLLDAATALAREAAARLERLYGAEPRTVRERVALAGALRSVAQVLMFTKAFAGAEAAIRRALALLVRSVVPMDAVIVTLRMWLCQVLLAQEQYGAAVAVCEDLVRTHRGEADEVAFTRTLGETLFDAGRVADAERAFRDAIALAHAFACRDAHDAAVVRAAEWQAANSLVAVHLELGRRELAQAALARLKAELPADAEVPATTSRNLRTLEALISPAGPDPARARMHAYVLNVLVRDRRAQNLPPGAWLRFTFQNPDSASDEPVYMNLEKQLGPDTRTVAVTSPPLYGFRPGALYTVAVEVLGPDHETLLTEHVQLVRANFPNALVL